MSNIIYIIIFLTLSYFTARYLNRFHPYFKRPYAFLSLFGAFIAFTVIHVILSYLLFGGNGSEEPIFLTLAFLSFGSGLFVGISTISEKIKNK